MSAARLEASKVFTKNLCSNYGIPTAEYEVFTDKDKALDYVKNNSYPQVIKVDGIASGKGVVIANNYEEAYHFIRSVMIDNVW